MHFLPLSLFFFFAFLSLPSQAELAFPNVSPVAFSIFGFSVHWYALAYLGSFFLVLYLSSYNLRKLKNNPYYAPEYAQLSSEQVQNLLYNSFFGIIIGGRLGYVLFYNLAEYIKDPISIFFLWQGGMSFHGAVLGVAFVVIWTCHKLKQHPFLYTDIIVVFLPIGIFFGRLANFVNGELWGRVSDVSWAIKFPHAGEFARHPSQLYEAFLEGILLFIILLILRQGKRPLGFLTAISVIGYSLSRIFVEFFREPDAQLALFFDFISMGQILSLPMLGLGIVFLIYSCRNKKAKDKANREQVNKD